MYHYPVEIHGIYIASEHRVFGKDEEDLSGGDLQSMASANLVADAGIEGDRFCRHRPDYNGHVTFFSREVWDEVVKELELPDTLGPELTRRNLIVSGVDLKALYGASFEISGIQFAGTIHCAPCAAMNRAIDPGATVALRGRGGLRAQVKTNGTLKLGSAELITDVKLDPLDAGSRSPSPNLP